MIGNWLGKKASGAPAIGGTAATGPRDRLPHDAGRRPLSGFDRELAIALMSQATSMMPLSEQDAATVTAYLSLRQFGPGESIFRDDEGATGTMLWILHGEITVETIAAQPGDVITITVLEPGRSLGEMGFIDGRERSARCTACSEVRCAQLTRPALQALSSAHPAVAVKLVTLICTHLSSRLRDVTEKFRRHVVMANLIRAQQHFEATPQVASDAS